MARVFVDTNILIDLVEKRRSGVDEQLANHQLFISPLSFHILLYVTKEKIPYKKLNDIVDNFYLVSFDKKIAYGSLQAPTADFEDNVQLHSATSSDCDIFLTSDQKLLKLKFFGKMELKPSL